MPLDTMMQATRELPSHVQQGLDAVEDLDLDLDGGMPENVVVCGMGGSSIGGALACRVLEADAPVPMTVVRGHTIPAWVDDGTLAVVTSYSGNTRETLDATRACVDAGAELVAVTTGGELGELAQAQDAPTVQVPAGFQPRAAVGWLFAANYGVLSTVLGVGGFDALRMAARRLEEDLDEMAKVDGTADAIAGELGAGPVGVVGHDVLGTVARRWAGEIAENGKRLAFHATLPEMAHNQLVGWDGDPAGATLVQVRRRQEGSLERVRQDLLAERTRKAGVPVVDVRVGGSGLDTVLEAVVLGDLVSLHLARHAGIDPEPVGVIDELKRRLEGAGG